MLHCENIAISELLWRRYLQLARPTVATKTHFGRHDVSEVFFKKFLRETCPNVDFSIMLGYLSGEYSAEENPRLSRLEILYT